MTRELHVSKKGSDSNNGVDAPFLTISAAAAVAQPGDTITVHEVFKALEEVALTAAYVVEWEDGEIVGYNCRVEQDVDILNITPVEKIVSRVHLNLRKTHVISCFFATETVDGSYSGLQWIGPA